MKLVDGEGSRAGVASASRQVCQVCLDRCVKCVSTGVSSVSRQVCQVCLLPSPAQSLSSSLSCSVSDLFPLLLSLCPLPSPAQSRTTLLSDSSPRMVKGRDKSSQESRFARTRHARDTLIRDECVSRGDVTHVTRGSSAPLKTHVHEFGDDVTDLLRTTPFGHGCRSKSCHGHVTVTVTVSNPSNFAIPLTLFLHPLLSSLVSRLPSLSLS